MFFLFHSIFPGSFSAVKISEVSLPISFHFSWIVFSAVKISEVSLPISFHFSWIIFCSSDFRLLT